MNRALFLNSCRTNPEVERAADRLRGFQCEDRPGSPFAIPFTAPRAQPAWVGVVKAIAGLAIIVAGFVGMVQAWVALS